jgi:hypothetical protein
MPEVACIDLKQQFGKRYKIGVEESVECPSYNTDPWYWEILCRIGPKKWKSRIYSYGGEYLAVMVTSNVIANRMRSWPELEVVQDADDAVVFKFHADHLDEVARAVGARTRRRLSPENRKKLTEAGTAALKKWRAQSLSVSLQLTKQRSPADLSLSTSSDSEGIE